MCGGCMIIGKQDALLGLRLNQSPVHVPTHSRVRPEWRLVKAQKFLAEPFTPRRVWQCFKDDPSGKRLHAAQELFADTSVVVKGAANVDYQKVISELDV